MSHERVREMRAHAGLRATTYTYLDRSTPLAHARTPTTNTAINHIHRAATHEAKHCYNRQTGGMRRRRRKRTGSRVSSRVHYRAARQLQLAPPSVALIAHTKVKAKPVGKRPATGYYRHPWTCPEPSALTATTGKKNRKCGHALASQSRGSMHSFAVIADPVPCR